MHGGEFWQYASRVTDGPLRLRHPGSTRCAILATSEDASGLAARPCATAPSGIVHITTIDIG